MTSSLSQKTFEAIDKGAELAERRAAVEEAARNACESVRLGRLERIDELRENAARYREAVKTAREIFVGETELRWLEAHERRQKLLEELAARQSALFERKVFGTRRLLHAFADAHSTIHREAMDALRKKLG
jgi:hypothetical protein